MSEPERGAYTPPHADAPLSFDPRQPVRGARPIPLTLILSVVVLAALVGAILWFYQSGVRQAGEAPQTVGAPVAGIKEAAKDEAQPQDPAAGLQIYRSDAGGQLQTVPAEPTFAPPPEAPQPRPTTPIVVAEAPPVKPAPAAAPPPSAAPSAAASQALKPALPAEPQPKAPPQPAPAKKVAAPPPPEKKTTPAAEPKAAAGGGARVQVGAVSSPALADRAWRDAVGAAPGLAAGKGKAVEKIEGGTLYRTFVTGFASKSDAQAFCAKLQAAGKSCFVR